MIGWGSLLLKILEIGRLNALYQRIAMSARGGGTWIQNDGGVQNDRNKQPLFCCFSKNHVGGQRQLFVCCEELHWENWGKLS